MMRVLVPGDGSILLSSGGAPCGVRCNHGTGTGSSIDQVITRAREIAGSDFQSRPRLALVIPDPGRGFCAATGRTEVGSAPFRPGPALQSAWPWMTAYRTKAIHR